MAVRTTRRQRLTEPTIVHRRDSVDLSVASPFGWDSRFLGLLSGLLCSRMLWPSEDASQGTGLSWCLWVIMAVLGFAAIRMKRAEFQYRFCFADFWVIFLVILITVSNSQAFDRRPATNMACEWMTMGLAYLVLRQVPRDSNQSLGILWSSVVMVSALACYGIFQTTVEFPDLRSSYLANPETTLVRLGIDPNSPSRKAFEDRLLGSNEPMATFALANSLAGVLVGPMIILIGLLLDQLLKPARNLSTRLARAIPLILILGPISLCLIWTKSRSSYVGSFAGLCMLSLLLLRRTRLKAVIQIVIPLISVATALFLVGLATGRLDLLVLTESTKSLQYRVEYWVATWEVIQKAGHWLWGIGPANFSYYYMQFKLPQASEEISDPHNLFLEVWVTAGVFALSALIAAILFALRKMTKAESAGADRQTDYEIFSNSGSQAVILGFSLSAMLIAPVLGGWNLLQEDLLRRWFVILISWAVGWMVSRAIISHCQVRAEHMAAALTGLTITWLASGGIGFPGVSIMFWMLMALGLNLADGKWFTAPTRVVFDIKLLRFLPIAGCIAVLGGFLGATIPFWQADHARARATELLLEPTPKVTFARQQLLRAIERDPSDATSFVSLADLEFQAWVVDGARPEQFETAWTKIRSAFQFALTPPRNPLAVTIWRREAGFIEYMLRNYGERIPPEMQLMMLGERAKCLRTAVKLYPASSAIWADLAEVDDSLG
ncbi:MAG: hypothetical protein RJA81_1032, partial [Planctomycetota bacterium]